MHHGPEADHPFQGGDPQATQPISSPIAHPHPMQQEAPQRTCEACDSPYRIDEAAMDDMGPPGNYRKGYARYCLTCWSGNSPRSPRAQRLANREEPINAPNQRIITIQSPREACRGLADLHFLFKETFGASDETLWLDCIERFLQSDGRICYYPSAGDDFEPLLYQQTRGMAKRGLTDASGTVLCPTNDTPDPGPAIGTDANRPASYHPPDLWIYSDYLGTSIEDLRAGRRLDLDDGATVRLVAHTELHPRTGMFRIPPSESYTSLPMNRMTGRVFYLRLAVSDVAGETTEADLIYFCVENVFFLQRFMLSERLPISHLVWVRDGAGYGGGRLRHDFLVALLPYLNTRWLFMEDRYLHEHAPGRYRWPSELRGLKDELSGKEPDLNAIGSFPSGGDTVTFCEVDSSGPDAALMAHDQANTKELMARISTMRPQPEIPAAAIYLWLRGEAWVKFGPYPSLRFDSEGRAILDPQGAVVARKEQDHWRVAGEPWLSQAFSEPTLTANPNPPAEPLAPPP